jgi:hypothetical protein
VLSVNYSRAKKVMDLLEKIAIEDSFMISIQDTSKLSSLNKVKVIQFLMHHIRNYRSTDINCNTLANKF